MNNLNEPFKLAFVGGGVDSAVGRVHKIACQMDGKFLLVAGCFSLNEQINKQSALEYGVPQSRLYENVNALISNEVGKIDAIVILTPTPTHKEIIIQALENNIPVISEKALAANSQEAREIIDCERKTGGFLAVTYNYTGYPMIRELRVMIESGKLGNVNQIDIEMPQEGFIKVNSDGTHNTPQAWRLKDGEIPTVSLDLGVHLYQMVDFLTNETPIELVATQDSFGHFSEVIDNVTSIIRYSNGMLCNMSYGKVSLGCRNGLKVRVFGTKGAAEWYQMEPEFLTFFNSQGVKTVIDRNVEGLTEASAKRYDRFKIGHPAGFIEAFANYYRDIASNLDSYKRRAEISNQFVYGTLAALEGIALAEHIVISDKQKKWVSTL